MIGYVVMCWYWVFEIMLNWMYYNQIVDIWFVGCIMVELFQGKVFFLGSDCIFGLGWGVGLNRVFFVGQRLVLVFFGRFCFFCFLCYVILGWLFLVLGEWVLGSVLKFWVWGFKRGFWLVCGCFLSDVDIDQLKCIMEVVGIFSFEVLVKIFLEYVWMYIQFLFFMFQKDLSSIFYGVNFLVIDFFGRMLVLDSDQRVSVVEVLVYVYFSQYYDFEDELEVELYDESVEVKECILEEWKEFIYQEVFSFKFLELLKLFGSLEIEQ